MRTVILICIMVGLIFINVVHAETETCSECGDSKIIDKFISATGSKMLESRDIGGLQEIVIERTMPNGKKKKELFYATPNYIIFGSALDINFRNITKERLIDIDRVDFSKLPLDSAIVVKKGNGSKKLAMFTDVDCSFCRRANEDLSGMDNYTLYVFMYPLDFHVNAKEKSIKVLCSTDKAKALDDAKHDRPLEAELCKQGEEMLARHILTATILEITGTPLFVLGDGRKIEGFNKPVIEEYLGGSDGK